MSAAGNRGDFAEMDRCSREMARCSGAMGRGW